MFGLLLPIVADVFDPFLRAYIENFSQMSINTDQFLDFLKKYFADQKCKLETVDWDKWLHAPGLPPYTPT